MTTKTVEQLSYEMVQKLLNHLSEAYATFFTMAEIARQKIQGKVTVAKAAEIAELAKLHSSVTAIIRERMARDFDKYIDEIDALVKSRANA